MQVLKVNCGEKKRNMSPNPLATEEQAECLSCTQTSPLLVQETNPLKQEPWKSSTPPLVQVRVWNIFLPELNVYVYIERRV